MEDKDIYIIIFHLFIYSHFPKIRNLNMPAICQRLLFIFPHLLLLRQRNWPSIFLDLAPEEHGRHVWAVPVWGQWGGEDAAARDAGGGTWERGQLDNKFPRRWWMWEGFLSTMRKKVKAKALKSALKIETDDDDEILLQEL